MQGSFHLGEKQSLIDSIFPQGADLFSTLTKSGDQMNHITKGFKWELPLYIYMGEMWPFNIRLLPPRLFISSISNIKVTCFNVKKQKLDIVCSLYCILSSSLTFNVYLFLWTLLFKKNNGGYSINRFFTFIFSYFEF